MKLMVSLLLLVAICHAAEASRSRQDEEERTAKRELQEGNIGLKIQPSFYDSASLSNPQALYDGSNIRAQGPPQSEYGPPRLPIAKISDVLSGQGASFPAAIQSHLYSSVPVYQPRLGSPTTFEVSPPVPSPLAYSDHRVYQAPQNIQILNNNLQAQNNQPSLQQPQPQQPPVQFNPFPAFSQLQPPTQPQQILSNQFLPRLDNNRLLSRLDFPQQIYQQVFSEQSGVIPQDIYQQINQLGRQLSYEETVQLSQASDDEVKENSNSGNAKQQEQKPGIQYASQTEEQGQLIADQSRAPQQQSSAQQNALSQPQAVSYARFSQSLPTTSRSQNQEQQVQAISTPQPLLQQQQLPQPKASQLFKPELPAQTQSTYQQTQSTYQQTQSTYQPTQSTYQPTQSTYQPTQSTYQPTQSTFQPTQSTYQPTRAQVNIKPMRTTPSPASTFFTANNPTPQRIGIVRIRQKLTTPEPRTSSSLEPQASSTSSSISIDTSQPSSTQQSQSTRYFTSSPRFQSRSTLRPTEGSTTTMRPSTLQSQNTFPSRPTLPSLPPLPRSQQTTVQSIYTSKFPTISPQPAFTQSLSTLPPQPITQTLPSSLTVSLQPQFIQPTVEPLLVLQPQQIQSVSTQQQPQPTVQPIQQLTTLQPLLVTQPQELSTPSQSNTPDIRPIPVQRQQFQAQSEPQSNIQFQVYKSEEKLQDQISQQPQLQLIQGPQQIQEQLQSIQQQLQLIQQQQPQLIQQQQSQLIQQQQPQLIQQQQPQLIQQQPQPVQIVQQQTQPIPQPTQLIQEQPIAQIVQQQPQPIELIQQQPQLIQSQPQLVQPLPHLIQPHPQEIQLIQQQTQPQQQAQPQQQTEPSPQPQTEAKQKSEQEQEQIEQNQQQSEKSEKQELERSQENNEGEDYYSELLHNNVYSEELYIQPQHLHPVPVAFPSYAASSLHAAPAFHGASSLHASPSFHGASSLHASPSFHGASSLHASPTFHGASSLHASPVHSSPSFHGHSSHNTPSFSSVQYYGKYAPGLFGGWR